MLIDGQAAICQHLVPATQDLCSTTLSCPPMSVQYGLRVTGAAALHLLKLTHESTDIFPPIKGVAAGALYITDLVVVCT